VSRAFSPYISVLPTAQKELWPKLRSAASLGLVLYGGTAAALRLGHRSSVDFDFFTDGRLDRSRIVTAFPFLRDSTLLQEQPNTLSFLTAAIGQHGQVKISFFGGIDHGRVGDPQWTEDEMMQVASLDDLMATKLKTLLQRIEAKDYRDIAAMLKAGADLSRGLASAACLYGRSNFQPSESLKALVYFQGGDLDRLSAGERNILVQSVRGVGKLPPVGIVSRTLALS
jgi:hypothetical protein